MHMVRSLFLFLLLALAGGGAGTLARTPDPPAPPPAPASLAGAPTSTVTPTPTTTPGCASQWQVVASPNLTPGDDRLVSIAAVGPDDLWAVGAFGHTNSAAQPLNGDGLILHGTANGWTVVPNPTIGGLCALMDVAGVAGD
jgi:hypothetical protein